LTKQQILAAYLNSVFYGRHAFGAQAAAQTYFSRSARSLTLPQAALLAGLPQAPSVYDAFLRPDTARARRNEVLHAMLVAHDINWLQWRWAKRRGGQSCCTPERSTARSTIRTSSATSSRSSCASSASGASRRA